MGTHLPIDEACIRRREKFIALWYRRRREAMRDGVVRSAPRRAKVTASSRAVSLNGSSGDN